LKLGCVWLGYEVRFNFWLGNFLLLIAVKKKTKKTNTRFWEFYTCFGGETKMGVVRILVTFKIGLFSATSKESFHRDVLNDMAELRSILKINPGLVSHPKQ